MADAPTAMSTEGIDTLKTDEGVIDGLYDDPSGYCTSGVGHLVHQKDKWGCFLLQAASDDDNFKKNVAKQWPGKPFETPYLTRSTAFLDKFSDLKTKAASAAKEALAQKRHNKSFDKLDKNQSAAIETDATAIVAEQERMLAKTTDATLTDDLTPFEQTVRRSVTAPVTQGEFDALVSLCFNIGITSFTGSGVVTEINKNKHKSGAAKDRKAAIDAIDAEFAKWNRSQGLVLDGLTKRRKKEADRFLSDARAARDEVLKTEATTGKVGTPSPVGGPKPLGSPAVVKPP
jgi:GH24 family phage-related lysozyme (muramidase)